MSDPENDKRQRRRMPLLYAVIGACVLITALSINAQAGNLLQLNFGNDTKIYFNDTESQINGTFLVNGSQVCTVASGCSGGGTDLNNYTTATSFTGNILSTSRNGASTLTATIPNNAITLACQNITGAASNLCTITGGGSSSGNLTMDSNVSGWPLQASNSTHITNLEVACDYASGYAIGRLSNNSVCFQTLLPATASATYLTITNAASTYTTQSVFNTQNTTNYNTFYPYNNPYNYLNNTTIPAQNTTSNLNTNSIPKWNGSQLINSSIYDESNSISIGRTNTTKGTLSIYSTSTSSKDGQYIEDIGTGAGLKIKSYGNGSDANAFVAQSYYYGATVAHIQRYLQTEPTINQAVLKLIKQPASGINDTGVMIYLLNQFNNTSTSDQPSIVVENTNNQTPFLSAVSGSFNKTIFKLHGSGRAFWNISDEEPAIDIISSATTIPQIRMNLVKNGILATNIASGGYGLQISSGTSGASSSGLISGSLTSTSVNSPTAVFTNNGNGSNNNHALQVIGYSYFQKRVGINTTVANNTLHVIGDGNFTENLYEGTGRVCTAANGLCGAGSGQSFNVTCTGSQVPQSFAMNKDGTQNDTLCVTPSGGSGISTFNATNGSTIVNSTTNAVVNITAGNNINVAVNDQGTFNISQLTLPQSVLLFDEWVDPYYGGSIEDGEAGMMGWNVVALGTGAGASMTSAQREPGRRGIMNLTTGSTNGGNVTVHLSVNMIYFNATSGKLIQFGGFNIGTTSGANNITYLMGFGDQTAGTAAAQNDTDAIWIAYNASGGNNNLSLITRSNSVQSENVTDIQVTAEKFYDYQLIVYNNTRVELYIDEQLKAILNTNIPSGNTRLLGPMQKLRKLGTNTGTTAVMVGVDYYGIRYEFGEKK